MKDILNRLSAFEKLSREEARNILTGIGRGEYNTSQVAAFLMVFNMRMVSVDELAGFRDAMIDLCLHTDLSAFRTIDLCGTGGDGRHTFNISTLASLVVAGAGGKVAKHGNYAVSSASGSSNVMEHFGYTFTSNRDTLLRQLDKAGICFLHAPLFHPAMKNVGPIRRDLGVKTFFNMLGPMTNPAQPPCQSIGVFSLETARLYQYIYQGTGKDYRILYSLDGYDEVSLTGEFKLISPGGEDLLNPEKIGFPVNKPEDLLAGNSVQEAASVFSSILEGKGTEAQNNTVIANAGIALQCLWKEKSLEECFGLAKDALLGKKALNVLNNLISLN
jgi:anthranilate phosphoribosyltransferase